MSKSSPFYFPTEFTFTVITAIYVPPDANAKLAMKGPHAAISRQQLPHPNGVFTIFWTMRT